MHEWKGIVLAIIHFAIIGATFGITLFPAAKQLYFNHWIRVSLISWIGAGVVYFVASMLMEGRQSIEPIFFKMGVFNPKSAFVAALAFSWLQIGLLKLKDAKAFAWVICTTMGLMAYTFRLMPASIGMGVDWNLFTQWIMFVGITLAAVYVVARNS